MNIRWRWVTFLLCILATNLAIAGDPAPATKPALKSRKMVFVCDASDSMVPKIDVVRKELVSVIEGLRPTQAFNLIFMRSRSCARLDANLMLATPDNKKAESFINAFTPGGKTDPIPAMEAAFAQHPGIVYLLADHDFPDAGALVARVAALNPAHDVKVNTIAFIGKADHDTDFMKALEEISKENDGVYKFLKVEDLGGK